MKTIIWAVVGVLILSGVVWAAEIELSTPAEPAPRMEKGGNITESSEPWILRTGRIQLAPQFDGRLGAAAERDILRLGLFAPLTGSDEGIIRVEVRRPARRSASGGFSVSGALPGRSFQTALFTVTGGKLMATIEDLEAGRIYQIVGDLTSGMGEVTEIDRRKMPPALHLPPIIPEQEAPQKEEKP